MSKVDDESLRIRPPNGGNQPWSHIVAVEAVGKLGPSADPALCKLLSDDDQSVRAYAFYALGRFPSPNALDRFSSPPGPAIQTVLGIVLCRDDPERKAVVETIEKHGINVKAVVAALAGLLTDKDQLVRDSAAESLGRIGPEAESAIPGLVRMAKDKGPQEADILVQGNFESSRRTAIGALGRIGPAAVGVLTELADDKDDMMRKYIADALGEIGFEARAAVPVLTNWVKRDDGVCAAASRALGQIGPDAATAVAPLMAPLDGNDFWSRYYAAEALGKIGSQARAAIPALTKLQKEGGQVGAAATEAIRLIEEEKGQEKGENHNHEDSSGNTSDPFSPSAP